jgi:hypothetical protein
MVYSIILYSFVVFSIFYIWWYNFIFFYFLSDKSELLPLQYLVIDVETNSNFLKDNF